MDEGITKATSIFNFVLIYHHILPWVKIWALADFILSSSELHVPYTARLICKQPTGQHASWQLGIITI